MSYEIRRSMLTEIIEIPDPEKYNFKKEANI